MLKRTIGAGLLGGFVIVIWTFLVNGIFGFRASIDMRPVPGDHQVHEILKEHILQPGRYVSNPALTPEGRFPDGEPVFSILYGGVGHESAGGLMLVGLLAFFIAPMIGAGMLSHASRRVLSSYPRKVLFFVSIGLVLAIFSDLMDFGIGGYPINDTLWLAANTVATWTLVGVVVAWRIRPGGTVAAVG